MACDIWDGFKSRTEDFAKEVYLKPSPPTPLRDAVPKGIYPQNIGLTRTVFRLARIEPTDDEPTWSDIQLVDSEDANGACAMTYNAYVGGFDEETYSPVQFGMKGPLLCRDEHYFTYEPAVWLDHYMRELNKLSARQLDNYLLARYMRRVPIGIADASFELQAASSTLTAPAATSELTQDMLDATALELIQAGATDPDSGGYIMLNGSKLYWTLLIGLEASKLILLNNSEFREDIRFAWEGKGEGSPLFSIVGADMAIKNFRHHQWLVPPRFSHNGTNYVRVNTYENVAATKGNRPRFTDAYRNAMYEGALVLSPHVMTAEFIMPKSKVDGVTWPPSEYGRGEWTFVTGKDAGCDDDPLHKRGRHFAEFKLALKPGSLPESGVLLIYRRCGNNISTSYCS